MSSRRSCYIPPIQTDFDELRLVIGKLLLGENRYFSLDEIAERKSGHGSRDHVAVTLGKMLECGEADLDMILGGGFTGTFELGIAIYGDSYDGVYSRNDNGGCDG